jgi:carbon storage regulator
MLVLSRKPSEEILIDGHITVKVLRVQGNRVYLGVEAPDDIGIRRGELGADAQRSVAREAVPAGATCCSTSV